MDDWINTLEIGNVMHPHPICSQEIIEGFGKNHEFLKDPILKKIVLIVVGFFSVATELRIVNESEKRQSLISSSSNGQFDMDP